MQTFTYRMDHDLGFAPNPFFGWCTLACCMVNIRRRAKIGDIIVGLAGSGKRGLGRIHPQVIYWMKVREALTFDAYWADPRFASKRPRLDGPKIRAVGDRTYRHEGGGADWSFEDSMHHVPGAPQNGGGHVVKDTKVDRLLVARDFTYWGGSGPAVPPHLMSLFPPGIGDRRHVDGPLVGQLHDFLGIDDPRGVRGDPADWENPRYFAVGK